MNSLKEAFSKQNLLKNLNFFGELNLGLILTAVGIVYFKNPNHFAFGGTSGLSILLADLFPKINVGGFMWIINLVLVVLGFVFLGVKCMGWTIYSSFALSFFVSVCEWLYPSGVSMSGDAMLDLVFAVFLPALGAAIVFDIGASTGGTDIVALILAKYTSMEIGKALMASDILIVLAAAWRFGMGTGLYCILGLIGKSFVVDGAIENIRLRKVCTIMTSNPQPILDFIIKEMNRSATVEKAYGAYTHHELSVLVTVLTRRQALQLRNFLRENDPHSFITIVNSIQFVGVSMIIYLAGLQTLDQSVMEAASLDGASGWKKFWNITLPMLQPAFTTSVVLNLIGGLKLFDIIKVLTNGGPGYATNSISTYISSMYFDAQNAGYASALGVFLFILIAIITYLLNTGLAKLNWEA